jgi:acetyltransferase-like isoleucine patch superfamily enzyme
VTRDTPANAIVAGNPAKLLRYLPTSDERAHEQR